MCLRLHGKLKVLDHFRLKINSQTKFIKYISLLNIFKRLIILLLYSGLYVTCYTGQWENMHCYNTYASESDNPVQSYSFYSSGNCELFCQLVSGNPVYFISMYSRVQETMSIFINLYLATLFIHILSRVQEIVSIFVNLNLATLSVPVMRDSSFWRRIQPAVLMSMNVLLTMGAVIIPV